MHQLKFYKKMVAFVMAYSFTESKNTESQEDDISEGGDDKSGPMMVPMADILNHVADNNAHLSFEEDSLKIVATKPIKKVKL